MMPLTMFVFRLACAIACGSIIGLERQLRRRSAGLVTNTLVAVGACIFILISESVIMQGHAMGESYNWDNLRVLGQIVTGIGFLGAGVILRDGFTIHGLNSAATVWCSAAVGSLCGFGMWAEAGISSVTIFLINFVLKFLEHKMEEEPSHHHKDDTPKNQQENL